MPEGQPPEPGATVTAGDRRVHLPRARLLKGAATVCLGLAGLSNGCTSTAVVGAAGVTAGFGLAQTQAQQFFAGSLKGARLISLDMAKQATLAAIQELQLDILKYREGEYDAYYRVQAEGGPEIKIQVTAKSPLITKFSVRVGIMGDQAVSRLILARIDAAMGLVTIDPPTPESAPATLPTTAPTIELPPPAPPDAGPREFPSSVVP